MHTSRYVITSYKCSIVLQTIKQLQQRLAELKRTLQKELVRHSHNLISAFLFSFALTIRLQTEQLVMRQLYFLEQAM